MATSEAPYAGRPRVGPGHSHTHVASRVAQLGPRVTRNRRSKRVHSMVHSRIRGSNPRNAHGAAGPTSPKLSATQLGPAGDGAGTRSGQATETTGGRSIRGGSASVVAMTVAEWQEKSLPLMRRVLVATATVFLLTSLAAHVYVASQIQSPPQPRLIGAVLGHLDCTAAPGVTLTDTERCVNMKVAALLEEQLIARRYHQANVSLLLRASIKYVGFVTGMVLAIVGAVFILGRLSAGMSELSAEGAGWKLGLKSMSPGLILAGLGTALIIATLYVNPPTGVTDSPVYLTADAAR